MKTYFLPCLIDFTELEYGIRDRRMISMGVWIPLAVSVYSGSVWFSVLLAHPSLRDRWPERREYIRAERKDRVSSFSRVKEGE